MDYTVKKIDDFEIRMFKNSNSDLFTGVIFLDNKQIGFKKKGLEKGDIIYMERGNKTSIIKRIRHAITGYNDGINEVVPVASLTANKFDSGNILIEKEINVVELTDVLFVFDAGSPYDENYNILRFVYEGDNEDNVTIEEEFINKDSINDKYVSIGKDLKVIELYKKINQYKLNIRECINDIVSATNEKLNMLNKSNKDFYNDLMNHIAKIDASEYEKNKYKEFVKAAYDNKTDV